MDKLGTYALVAALKEISRKQQPSPNERWVSLRSCMTDLEQTSIEPIPASPPSVPFAPAVQAAAIASPVPARLSTTPPKRSHAYIQQINARHQNARRQNP